MEKNCIEIDMVKKSKDLLEFYLEYGNFPVHQDISNHSKQMETQCSLYRYLGLPSSYLSGNKI